jgi:16S rRNA (cytosine967-C5)-methyltransferase
LTAENEAIVESFLARHPGFALLPAAEIVGRPGAGIEGDMLRLLPHVHNTDGFFAAALERRA